MGLSADHSTKSLRHATFAVLDTETTGLDVWEWPESASVVIKMRQGEICVSNGKRQSNGWNRIVELGAILVDGSGKKRKTYHSYVNPMRHIPEEATEFHGISDEDVRAAPPASEALADLIQFLEPADMIVGFHSPFDLRFIVHEMLLSGFPVPNLVIYDVARIAYSAGFGRTSLVELAAKVGLRVTVAHRALADAEITASILSKFIQTGFQATATLGDFIDLHDSRTPVYDTARALASVQATHDRIRTREAREARLARSAVCLTGALPGVVRNEIASRLESVGYRYVREVSESTEFVVVGHKPAMRKIESAEALGIATVSGEEFLAWLEARECTIQKKQMTS